METTTQIQEFLAGTEPFNQLPSEVLGQISSKLQPWRYRMGQVILMRGKISSHLVIIIEGQARLLGYDPRNQMPVTLRLLNPGAILGWLDLLRGVAVETVIASKETTCLMLDKADFVQLLEKYPEFAASFREQCSPIELFDVLGNYLEGQARGGGNLKELSKELIADALIYQLPPGKTSLKEHNLLQDQERIWLVSGGGSIVNYPVGSPLGTDGGGIIEIQDKIPARLVGLPYAKLQDLINEQELKQAETNKPEPDFWEENNTAAITRALPPTTLTGETGQETEDIPYANVEVLYDDTPFTVEPEKKQSKTKTRYPYIRGKTPLDASTACFQMLAQYFGMPFRRDVVRRIIGDQIERTGGVALPICGAIGELLGLKSQLLTIPANSLVYLSVPALVRWQNKLVILYEIHKHSLVLGVPEKGIVRLSPEEFIRDWGQQGEVLLLSKTKETPQERFGLNWFIPSVRRHWKILTQVLVASFFVQLFGLVNPLMIQVIIDKVIVQNSIDTLQILGIFLLVIGVFEAVLGALRTYLFVDTTNRIDMVLGSEIIDHLLRLPLNYFEKRPVGEISTRVNELENIRQFLTGTALTVVLDAVFSVVYIVVMCIYSPLLTLVALSILPVLFILTLVYSPIIRRQLRKKAERNAETQSYLVEVMTGIQTVKAQNIELLSRWQWQDKYSRYVSAGFDTVITSTLAGSASNFLNKLSGLLVLWVGVYLVLKQEMTLGQLIAFRIIAGYVTSPLLRLGQIWQNFQETALSLERLSDIVDNPQEAEQDRLNIPMPLIRGFVKYENVSFRFKPNGPLQLNNINLEFAAGTFIAVVGQSGAGKSTLTKLLARLYTPEAGRILVDGYDINKVELYSLRRQVGVVPQETLLFDGSVQENIALTNPDASTEEIIEAAKAAAAHEFIMNLPNGYNSRVGERGSALSGGQRQRIAIARSVLQRPRMLILDEATSALDYATEQEVFHNLSRTFRDRTVFFITHRLASIKSADIIVMMDTGMVVEQGTHEQLMALKGRYFYLYQQQESSL